MNRSTRIRILAATALAAMVAEPAAAASAGTLQPAPADRNQAAISQLDFGFAQGWRTDHHLRETVDLGRLEIGSDVRADVVGFGDQGIHVSFGAADGTLTDSSLRLRNFGRGQGWRTDRHLRVLADVGGDGSTDVIGFGDRGIFLSHGARYGHLTEPLGPEKTVADFGYNQGWRTEHHLREVADLDGEGGAEIVGFGDAGVHVADHAPRGSSTELSPATLRLADFGRDQGWRIDHHVRELADVDGDGLLDIVGFGDAGVHVARGQADGTFTDPVLAVADFGRHQGWRVDRHPRHVADVNADGRADLVGFGHAGVWVSHAAADGTFGAPAMTLRDLGVAQGWRTDRHQRELVDLDDDGRADIVAFGDAGTYASYAGFDGNFAIATLELADFGWDQGWRPDRHVRRLADVTGDGLPEIVGFGELGTLVTDRFGGQA